MVLGAWRLLVWWRSFCVIGLRLVVSGVAAAGVLVVIGSMRTVLANSGLVPSEPSDWLHPPGKLLVVDGVEKTVSTLVCPGVTWGPGVVMGSVLC